MQVTASQIEKYSTATFFQDARFFQNRASYEKKASNAFVCSSPLNLLYTHGRRVCFCRMTVLPSNTARESLHVFLRFSRGIRGISNSHSTIDDLPDMADLSLCELSWL